MTKFKIVKYRDIETSEDAYDEVDCCYFDGYHIAERILEGVPIKITLSEDKSEIIATGDYYSGIDKAYYNKLAVESISQADVLQSSKAMDDDMCSILIKLDNGSYIPYWEYTETLV